MDLTQLTSVATSLGFRADQTEIWFNKYRNHLYHAKERGLRSELTFHDYMFKLVLSGITRPEQVGLSTGQFVLARLGDVGDYTVESCRFITTHQNIQEAFENGRMTGSGEQRRGRTKQTHAGIAAQAAKLAKKYVMVDPDGIEHRGSNIKEFCEANNLNVFCVYNVLAGRVPHHKGWTGRYGDDQ